MITLSQATAIRQSAEADFEINKSDENLRRLKVASKREMDLVLNAFDARQAAETAKQEAAQVEEPQVSEDADETAQMMDRIRRSMDESNARVARNATPDTRPHGAAYAQYVSDGIGDTDGYFAPLAYDRWVIFFAG